jgi:hypothetical protein
MDINQAKALLDANFGEYHLFDIFNPEYDDPRLIFVAMIAHDNVQKDVWFTEQGIDGIIHVPYDNMGTDEQTRWNEYKNKQE